MKVNNTPSLSAASLPKDVFFIGARQSKVDTLKEAFPNATFVDIPNHHHVILGIEQLERLSKELSGNHLRIYILAHGFIADGQHRVDFGGEGQDTIPTKELFGIIKHYIARGGYEGHPIQLYMSSCYGEAAAQDIAALPDNSILTIWSGMSPSSAALNIKQMVRSADYAAVGPWQEFADSIAVYPGDATIVTNNTGNIFRHTFRTPRHVMNDTALSQFFTEETQKYTEALKASFPSTTLSPPVEMTKKQRAAYQEDGCFVALYRKNITYIESYLAAGNSPDITSPYFNTTLIYDAVHHGAIEPVELLLKHNVSLEQGNTLLYIAATKGHQQVAKCLIDHGIDPYKATKENGLYSQTAHNGHTEVVRLLLSCAVRRNDLGESYWALYGAVRNGHTDVVSLLLDFGINPRLSGEDKGADMLKQAAERGYSDIVRMLSEYGVVDKENAAVLAAVTYGHVDTLRFFLQEQKVDPNTVNNEGTPLLIKAIVNPEMTKLLLAFNANPNIRPKGDEVTPLLRAAEDCRQATAILLENGANPNVSWKKKTLGATPLTMVLRNGCAGLAQDMIAKGAYLDTSQHDDITARQLIHASANQAIRNLTYQYGGKIIPEGRAYLRVAPFQPHNIEYSIGEHCLSGLALAALAGIAAGYLAKQQKMNKRALLAGVCGAAFAGAIGQEKLAAAIVVAVLAAVITTKTYSHAERYYNENSKAEKSR